eukprot:3180983-Alexandrium_andersonii.AAC.1
MAKGCADCGLADCGLESASSRIRNLRAPQSTSSLVDSESARNTAQDAPQRPISRPFLGPCRSSSERIER